VIFSFDGMIAILISDWARILRHSISSNRARCRGCASRRRLAVRPLSFATADTVSPKSAAMGKRQAHQAMTADAIDIAASPDIMLRALALYWCTKDTRPVA
jgi:hypothetical protein